MPNGVGPLRFAIAKREVAAAMTMHPTRTIDPYASIPFPAGAVKVDEWVDLTTQTLFRFFKGSRRLVERPDREDVDVWIVGLQYTDGTIARDIVVHVDESLTVAQGRGLAAALLEAADEVDGRVVGPVLA
jgi:hypothetical protein